MELEQLAQQAIAIVEQAGELICSIPRPQVYTKEGHANFVTEADMASQRFLIEHLPPAARGPLLRRGAGGKQDGPRLELGD